MQNCFITLPGKCNMKTYPIYRSWYWNKYSFLAIDWRLMDKKKLCKRCETAKSDQPTAYAYPFWMGKRNLVCFELKMSLWVQSRLATAPCWAVYIICMGQGAWMIHLFPKGYTPMTGGYNALYRFNAIPYFQCLSCFNGNLHLRIVCILFFAMVYDKNILCCNKLH